MKKNIFLILLLLPTLLCAQHHLYSHAPGVLYEIDLSNCSTREISSDFRYTNGTDYTDIAVTPNNRIFALNSYCIVEVDYSNGATLNTTFLPSNLYFINSLVAQSNDYLLSVAAADEMYLVRYSIKDGTIEYIGSLGYHYPAGDLAWHGGKLYMTTLTGELLQITISGNKISNLVTMGAVMIWGSSYGMSTYTNGDCAQGEPSLYLFGGTEVVSIDPVTLQTNLICSTPYLSLGASSTMDALNRFSKPRCTEISMYAPSLFTPNSDGMNDEFSPMIDTPVQSLKMQIFNRWGDRVYEEKSNTPSWDGKIGNTIHSSDVYYYLITATYSDGEETNYKGTISLIR